MAIGTLLVDHAITELSEPRRCTFWPLPSPATASPIRPPSRACSAAKLVRSAGDSTSPDTLAAVDRGLLVGRLAVVVEIGGADDGSLGSVVACVSVGAEATGSAAGSGWSAVS